LRERGVRCAGTDGLADRPGRERPADPPGRPTARPWKSLRHSPTSAGPRQSRDLRRVGGWHAGVGV